MKLRITLMVVLVLTVGIVSSYTAASAARVHGACVALTGDESCDWSRVRPCMDPVLPIAPLPCVETTDGQTLLYLEHVCPALPAGVTCIDTTGPDYDASAALSAPPKPCPAGYTMLARVCVVRP